MENQSRRTYATDLNDAQWQRIAPFLVAPTSGRGCPRRWPYRKIVNAIFSAVRRGQRPQ